MNSYQRILLESKADKLALRFLKEKGVTDYNEQMRIIGALKHDVPNLRLDKGKFVLGGLRLYYDGQLSEEENIRALDTALKYIHAGGHTNEYDENLNGVSIEELGNTFRQIAKQESEGDRERSANVKFEGGSKYNIFPVDTFDEASEYSYYTSWCVTHDDEAFDNYTRGGNRFYFCLAPGFEEIDKNEKGAPLNEYGLSMIAVNIDVDGNLTRVTTRYNHEFNGENNPGLETTEQLEKVLNVSFYETFKPYTDDELLSLKGISTKRELGVEDLEGLTEITMDFIDQYPKLTKITIPGSVRKICEFAFGDCDSNIESVTILPGVREIEKYAFSRCHKLKELVIPETVSEIGNSAFWWCDGLKSVTLPNSLIEIHRALFSHCSAIESIQFGNNVKYIGPSAFAECTSLVNVVLPDTVETVSKCAFSECTSLQTVHLSESLMFLEAQAFCDCTNLREVNLPAGVQTINAATFSGCVNLTKLQLPESLFEIKFMAFYGCCNLHIDKLPDTIVRIEDEAFRGCLKLSINKLPDEIRSIGDNVFAYCSRIKSLIVPRGICLIGKEAFRDVETIYHNGQRVDNEDTHGAKRVLRCDDNTKNENYSKIAPDELHSLISETVELIFNR